MIVLDFETYYDKEYSLSKLTMEEYINSPQFETIGFAYKKDSNPIEWVHGKNDVIAKALEDLHLENEVVVCHNAAFDCAILNWRYGIKPKFIVDTLSMARPVIGLNESCSLRNLAQHYQIGEKGTEIYNTLGKHASDFTVEEMQAFGEYCKLDVYLTAQLLPLLIKDSSHEEMYLIDLIIHMFTEPVIELDSHLLANHLADVMDKNKKLLDSVGNIPRDVFMSNDKFAELLRAEGIEPPTKISDKTGKRTWAFAKTDREFKSLLTNPNERVQALVGARLGLKSTIEETRTKAFLDIAGRGKLPIQLNYYGAANTGRFSGGGDLNPQNLPRGGALRFAMKAPKGYKIVACDSSNIEARTLAWFAGEEELLSLFRANADVYSDFASKVFGRPINKHDNPKERFIGKTCTLGLGYGTGGAKLQMTLHNGGATEITLDKAKEIVGLYRRTYKNIKKLWGECDKALDRMYNGFSHELGTIKLKCDPTDKSILLPNGLKLYYPELYRTEGKFGWEYVYSYKKFKKNIYGGALTENIIQALARIVVSYQMCQIKQELDKMSATKKDGKIRRVVHMVHDEVVCVVPEDEQKEVQDMMVRIMSTAPKWAEGLPVSCEAGGGDSYGDAK